MTSASEDSEVSSIYTNASAEEAATSLKKKLDEMLAQEKITPDEHRLFLGGVNRMHLEINHLKKKGRQWEQEANNAGGEFEAADAQLKETDSKLQASHSKIQTMEGQLKAKEAELQRAHKDYAELKEKHEQQAIQLHEYESGQAELDALIAKLTQDSEAIRKNLNMPPIEDESTGVHLAV